MAQILIKTTAPLPHLPLSLNGTHICAETTIEQFGPCDVVVGLDRGMVDQLILRSNDTSDEALARTSDRTRFFDHHAYEAWYAKNRTPFALIHRTSGDLMALVWIGPKKPASDTTDLTHTLAYRSYPPYRGGGFMTSFVSYVLHEYRAQNPNHHFWVCIATENLASRKLAEKLGFTIVHDTPNTDTDTVMILTH